MTVQHGFKVQVWGDRDGPQPDQIVQDLVEFLRSRGFVGAVATFEYSTLDSCIAVECEPEELGSYGYP